MEPDWARLGRAFAAARKSAGLTQAALAERIGVTRTTVQAIERGVGADKPTGTMRSYARFVGWPDGAIEAVLAGGDPLSALAENDAPPGRRQVAGDLPLRIVEEIGEGPLLDTTVLDLTPDGSGARMIVVVRGAPDASPDEIRRDLLAWRRAQRHLQDLGDGDNDEPPAPVADQA
jgi:DNA-binding XRE family transcriptional regulator